MPTESSSSSAMEQEKAAVKRSVAHEAEFREEKQRIVASLGGSRSELVSPSVDDRVQRKLNSNPTASSLFSIRGFEGRHDSRPEQAIVHTDGLPGAFNVSTPPNVPEHNDRASVQIVVDSAVHSENMYDDVEPVEAMRRRGPKFQKNTCYIAAAVVFAVTLGGIAGAAVALLNGAASGTFSPSNEPSSEGTDAFVDDGTCKLDHEALVAQCENGVLAVPDCAADTYLDLANAYPELLMGAEYKCDAAHQGLVALAVSQTNHGEVDDPIMFFAMSTLFFALKGEQWRMDTNWLKGSSPCNGWYGVTCSDEDSSISISISMKKNQLHGTLPTELGLLTTLRHLGIAMNELAGTLPSEIGLLTKLEELDIGLTWIHTTLPTEIGMLTELTLFYAASVPLKGSIPSEIGNMVKLEKLEFGLNQCTGTLPTELGNLIELRRLSLKSLSGITGTIPTDLISLTKLEQFEIQVTGISPSPFPQVLALATNLTVIQMSATPLTGELPPIGHLTHLVQLRLAHLPMSGTIPTEIGLLTDLYWLSFFNSNIGGSVPTEVGLLTKLSTLELTETPTLTGTLPSELGSLTALELLDVSNTALKGTIPTQVCALNLVDGIFDYDYCIENSYYADENCLMDTCSRR